MVVGEVFDPVKLSLEENQYLLTTLGQPTTVAMRNIPATPGIAPAAIKAVLDRVNELEDLQKHENMQWVGVEKVKEAIQVYLREAKKWQDVKRIKPSAPRFPSLYSFDSRNRPHWGGVGSDSGQVKTYFDDKGARHEFAIALTQVDPAAWEPEWAEAVKGTDMPGGSIKHNAESRRLECFCGHTETYKADSLSSFNTCKARMSKHLKSAKDEVDRHREAITEFN